MDYNERIPVSRWSEADKPREKLRDQGSQSLSDAELIAIILRSGSRKDSALSLAKKILQSIDGDLHILGRKSLEFFMEFNGVGEAKAISLAAAIELGRRRGFSESRPKSVIKESRDVYSIMASKIAELDHEEFWTLYLNRANKIITFDKISRGGISGTVVDPKLIFKHALKHLSSSIILVHNHPSGQLKPSQADISITQKLKEAGKVLEIQVLDHLIISDEGFFSFADEGLL